MLKALLEVLYEGNTKLTLEDYADIVWLAAQHPTATERRPVSAPSGASKPLDTTTPLPKSEPPSHNPPERVSSLKPDDRKPAVGLSVPGNQPDAAAAVPFRVPAATALPHQLALGRSLRPLMRHVPSRTHYLLDEQATAENLADQRRVNPSLTAPVNLALIPAQSRWLDVALIVDEAPSMVIWQQTINQFYDILAHQGAFRTVSLWGLVAEQNSNADNSPHNVKLYTRTPWQTSLGREASPLEVVDPGRRRLVLMVTDCTSDAWYQGQMAHVLRQLAAHNLVTIVQMLPERLWSSSVLAESALVRLSSLSPGQINRQFSVQWPWYGRRDDLFDPLSFPVITLEPEFLSAWARFVCGLGRAPVPGVCLPKFDLNQAGTAADETANQNEPDLSYAELFQRFRATASPPAQELAGYLAAAPPPITLAVMRLVQAAMLPQSQQVHLAEVFRSGLLKRISSAPAFADSERLDYDFVSDEIRRFLLSTVLTTDAKRAFDEVSRCISQHSDSVRQFMAALESPSEISSFTIPAGNQVFAEVSALVLRRLGGRYAISADAIESRLNNPQPASSPEKRESHVSPPAPKTNSLRVLVVENEPQWRQDHLT